MWFVTSKWACSRCSVQNVSTKGGVFVLFFTISCKIKCIIHLYMLGGGGGGCLSSLKQGHHLWPKISCKKGVCFLSGEYHEWIGSLNIKKKCVKIQLLNKVYKKFSFCVQCTKKSYYSKQMIHVLTAYFSYHINTCLGCFRQILGHEIYPLSM